MSIKVENEGNNKVKIEIVVGAEEFEEGMNKAYIKNVKRITIPGFRKGKAPRKYIEKYYGESIFYDDAINFICPLAYDKAVEEKQLEPVERPEIDLVQIGEGKPLIFTARVTVKPEVTLGKYKGLKVKKAKVSVSDEEVEKELSAILEKSARMTAVTGRAIEENDTVTIDFEGFIDGEPFAGGKGEGYPLVIGSGQFIPGFEEQLIGKNEGEDAEVKVTFPEDYGVDELKGKEALFKVKIGGVKVKELPALDDEFAKDVSEFDTLDELKADIKEKLIQKAQSKADIDYENELLDMAAETAEIDIPECMIEQQIDRMVQDFSYNLSTQGITLEQYAAYTGTSVEEIREKFKEGAGRNVKISLVLEQIAKAEGVEATDEDLTEEYTKMAQQYQMEVEKVRELMQGSETDVKESTVRKKTIELLKTLAG